MTKWVCNKCGSTTYEKPKHRNTTCSKCGRGRCKCVKTCMCGREYFASRSSQNYCSKECGYRFRETGGKKGKHYPDAQRASIRKCEVCGKEFRAVKDYGDYRQIYCSKECWSERAVLINQCKQCGKEIITTVSQNKQYCNAECRDLHYRERFAGASSHLWKGGKTKISKLRRTNAQYIEWRNSVFARDNYTCQHCGKQGCYIEAHHIKEQSKYPDLIYEIDDGLTLCRDCHKETDNYGYKARWENLTGHKAELSK